MIANRTHGNYRDNPSSKKYKANTLFRGTRLIYSQHRHTLYVTTHVGDTALRRSFEHEFSRGLN